MKAEDNTQDKDLIICDILSHNVLPRLSKVLVKDMWPFISQNPKSVEVYSCGAFCGIDFGFIRSESATQTFGLMFIKKGFDFSEHDCFTFYYRLDCYDEKTAIMNYQFVKRLLVHLNESYPGVYYWREDYQQLCANENLLPEADINPNVIFKLILEYINILRLTLIEQPLFDDCVYSSLQRGQDNPSNQSKDNKKKSEDKNFLRRARAQYKKANGTCLTWEKMKDDHPKLGNLEDTFGLIPLQK